MSDDDSKEESTNDNGMHYLMKGEYTIEIIQNDNISNARLIIN